MTRAHTYAAGCVRPWSSRGPMRSPRCTAWLARGERSAPAAAGVWPRGWYSLASRLSCVPLVSCAQQPGHRAGSGTRLHPRRVRNGHRTERRVCVGYAPRRRAPALWVGWAPPPLRASRAQARRPLQAPRRARPRSWTSFLRPISHVRCRVWRCRGQLRLICALCACGYSDVCVRELRAVRYQAARRGRQGACARIAARCVWSVWMMRSHLDRPPPHSWLAALLTRSWPLGWRSLRLRL